MIFPLWPPDPQVPIVPVAHVDSVLVYRLEHAPNAELMTAFSREATNKLREFAPQNISNMLWAYATLGHSPGRSVDLFWPTPRCQLHLVVITGWSPMPTCNMRTGSLSLLCSCWLLLVDHPVNAAISSL